MVATLPPGRCGTGAECSDHQVSTLLFTRTCLPADVDIWLEQWPIGHVWSLNVEEHSDILLAVLTLLAARAPSRSAAPMLLAAVTVAALVFNLLYVSHPPAAATSWTLRSECASLGLLAAATLLVLRRRNDAWVASVPALLPVLAFLVALACCVSYPGLYGLDRTLAPLCLAFAIVTIDCVPPIFRSLLSMPVLRWFGRCSFSVYLWQQPIYLVVLERRLNPVFGLALAIALGAVSFYCFENPLRIKLNHAWSSRSRSAPNLVGS